ncbi:lipid-A-disaccharide synthase [Desulfonauticus submarinus]|nr:lipid-A-disaccharide synthase [Desulfonauticus submarinus]
MDQKMSTIWINACEPSADIYASLLIKWLKKNAPNIDVVGMGGIYSRQAGLKTFFKAEELSVMGFTEVITNLPRIIKLLSHIKSKIKQVKPDLILLLDAPDFNFRLAKYADGLNIPVFYYIAPQLWAWRQGRVKFLKKYIKHIFCIFPFEENFFHAKGIKTSYVGHPLLELIDFPKLSVTKKSNTLLILPGSRKQEINSLLPIFNQTALLLKEKHPNLNFKLIKADNISLNLIHKFLSPDLKCTICPAKDRYKEMVSSKIALAASGTVTLECALMELPTVIAYKLSPLTFQIGKLLVKVPAIGMPNLILKEKIFPEFIQHQATPENLSQAVLQMLQPEQYQHISLKTKQIKKILGEKKATSTIGQYIIKFLKNKRT